MSRIGITFEEVKKAIVELQGRQKNPTVDAIREILGTGSKSTIARYLREWKAQHGLGSDSDGRLPSDLLGIVNGLWDALQNKADEQINQYRQEADSKTVQIHQQLTQARQLETSLRQNIHTLEEQFHQQKTEAQQLNAKLMIETQEKIRVTERAASLEVRCHEHHAENQRLHQLLKHVQENIEHYQAATQKLREEQSLFVEKQQNEYEERLSLLLAQTNAATSEKFAYQAQHDQLAKMYESQVTEHRTLTTQHAEINSQHEFLKIAHGKIQHDHDVLKEQNQAQAAELMTIQRTAIELRLNIKSRDEKIASLEEALARGNDKIETLRHENQFALQEKASLEGQLKQMQTMLSSGKMRAVS
jgi:chromosome segregation ATPase